MLAGKALRTGYGIEDLRVGGIESRRRERVFGESGSGRTKGLSTGIKIEKLGAEYEPRDDSMTHACARSSACLPRRPPCMRLRRELGVAARRRRVGIWMGMC